MFYGIYTPNFGAETISKITGRPGSRSGRGWLGWLLHLGPYGLQPEIKSFPSTIPG